MENPDMEITADSTSKEIAPIAMAIHEVIVDLPITMRTRNKRGVRIERGKVLDDDYSGPILEMAIESNSTIRTVPKTGDYAGTPVTVTTIKDADGVAIAAIGVVDVIHGL
ncbi:MAG: DUF2111 domain-containing protein [Methanosarcinales archaeon]|jgi:hypothetical protein